MKGPRPILSSVFAAAIAGFGNGPAFGSPTPPMDDAVSTSTPGIAPGDAETEASAEASASSPMPVARTSGRFGIDLRLGLSNGMMGAPASVGLDLVYAPWAPIFLYAGIDSNGATVAGHFDAQVNLLTLFTRVPWTPFVRAGYSQFWFTSLADDILDSAAPQLREDLAEVGTDLRFAGVHMHLVQVGGGIDLVSRGGFHFQALLGRSFMIGESRGRDAEESVELTQYQSWNVSFTFGWLFI